MIRTLSMCPVCYKKIAAEIVYRADGAWMTKTCDEHGYSESLVDPDISLISANYNVGTLGRNKAILVPITDICNMSCSWCYIKDVKTPLKPAEYYSNQLIDLKEQGYTMLLSGGEPTVIPEFFDYCTTLKKLGWPVVTMSNMVAFAEKDFLNQFVGIGMATGNILHADFSMQTPGNYNDEIFKSKVKALENMELLGYKANCIQFSIQSLEELYWIRKFYENTKHLYKNIRIRTLYGFWKDQSKKQIYLSQLYWAFMQVFGDLTPVSNNTIEVSNLYSIYLRDADCGISLSSAPNVGNVDLRVAARPTYAYALDNKYYAFPVTQIVNEGIQAGWYNGFRIGGKDA